MTKSQTPQTKKTERGCKAMGKTQQKPIPTTVSSVKLIAPEEQREEKYLPMLHGKATDALALMTGKPLEENPLNQTASITSGEVKLVVRELDKLSGTLGVSTHKLLSTAIASFTNLNHTGLGNQRDLRTGRVSIPLKEYALKCGYDVLEHTTETPEDEEKEALRAKRQLDNARRKIKKDILLLRASSLTWEEKVKGKAGDFADIGILGAGAIRNGSIMLEFTTSIAEYLIQLPLTQYPVALLSVDERNNNAYSMGLAMAEHYSLDNNHIRGTAQLLKVKTILGYTSLPTIDTIRKQRTSWEARIKEPFETALDALTACGLLADWRYSKSKGEELTEEEATTLTSYEDWAETLIYFTLKDAPDHTARIEARQEEKKARQTKRRRTAKRKEG